MKNTLWVVEAANCYQLKYFSEKDNWNPVIQFGTGQSGIYKNRDLARKAAKNMESTNQYNKHTKTVKYRVKRYVSE